MSSGEDQTQRVGLRYLCEADAEALDAYLQARAQGGGQGAMPAPDAERAQRLAELLTLLEAVPSEEPDARLTERTMAAVNQTRQRERFANQIQALTGGGGPGVGWREIGSAAAVLLLMFTLLVPVLSRGRAESRRLACESQLQTAGQAFGSYAQDHGGELPRGAVQPGSPWFNVGADSSDEAVRSNSANLYLLVRDGDYIEAHDLACPGNAHAPERGALTADAHDWPHARAVSYSYQNQYTREPIRLEQHADLALLADKNPLFVPSNRHVRFDREAPAQSRSRFHGGRGQNVLLGDGRVVWTVQPVLHAQGAGRADNIWLIRGVSRYDGTEVPDGADSFLVP